VQIKAMGLACVAVAYATPLYVHHSFTMFDAEGKKALAGTVKAFRWTNPHAGIILLAIDDNGRQSRWAVELSGASGLAHQGLHQKTFTPEMPVTVTIHPLPAGTSGGQVLTLTPPDGTRMRGLRATPPPTA